MNDSIPNDHATLAVEHLSIDFGPRRVVDDLSFALHPGKTLCIAGGVGQRQVADLSGDHGPAATRRSGP